MSKVTPKFKAIIKKGVIEFEQPEKLNTFITKYEGKEVLITIKRFFKGRSIRANNLYWLWLTCIGNELGYDIEDLHCTFKATFLVNRKGKIPIVRSTTSLTTSEFMEYMEKIARKMSDIGISLPNPDEAE